MNYEATLGFARNADRQDPLRSFAKQFVFPRRAGKKALYFVGNSLGLQPKTVRPAIAAELEKWGAHGVEGFFTGSRPWMKYHRLSQKILAGLVGARPDEVVAMNQLTVNIHLMMASFYRPQGVRTRILMEAGSFPSDRYAVASQVRWHGLDPAQEIVEVRPRPGCWTIETEDVMRAIHEQGDRLALVLIGGVQYYTGQFFNIRQITAAGHAVGARVGVDLAHAIGNVPLSLHDDQVDFAVWCGYKYLNSGPGGLAGVFVHERHGSDRTLPRLTGWWGRDPDARFNLSEEFVPMAGASGWMVSTVMILPGAVQMASLELFKKAGFKALRSKSIRLTGFLDFLLRSIPGYGSAFRIITPSDPAQRGCQLSVHIAQGGEEVFRAISRKGVMADWRNPNVIRVSPVPMYNSYEDVYRFYEIFKKNFV